MRKVPIVRIVRTVLPARSYPFIFKEGIAEQSYMIRLIGESERQKRPRSWLTSRLFSVISAPIAMYFAFRTRTTDLLPWCGRTSSGSIFENYRGR